MKHVLLCCVFSISTLILKAQCHTPTTPQSFELVVAFASMGTGTSSDTFLKKYVKLFSANNKIIIPAYRRGGCGREGEFYIFFSTSKLKPAIQKKFSTSLKNEIIKQEAANRKRNPNSGSITLENNGETIDFSHCSSELVKW